jgi:hypothetical protein
MAEIKSIVAAGKNYAVTLKRLNNHAEIGGFSSIMCIAS